MHPSNELGDGLVAFLIAQSYALSFTPIYQIWPGMSDTNTLGSDLRVIVAPIAWDEHDWSTREKFSDTVTMSIGVMQKLPAGTAWDTPAATTWMRARLDLVDEIIASLQVARDDDYFGDFTGSTPTNPVLINGEILAASNVFQSVIQITFNRNE